ncbi:GatB/YqeY domain-containing protein [Rossellomorea marisflavi]|uniref:GatB/YqeY domain-containing protein n=1 Tax=Rossellomorea marisflavi TaxID=189381 RepID=UPI003F9F6EB3
MLKETIQKDLVQAMRDKDKLKKGVLTLIKSGLTNAEKEKRAELNDAEELAVIQKELKQTRQALTEAVKVGREDNAELEKQKIAIIEAYLPTMLTEDEIRQLLAENGVVSGTNMGQAMKTIKPLVAGKADNALVARVVKETIA